MENAEILDVDVLADGDPVIVAAQNAAEPDAGAFGEAHAPDQRRIGRDPVFAGGGQFRGASPQARKAA